jgi:hypothetical protein
MSKYTFILLLAVFGGMMSTSFSANEENDSPSEVATKFLQAIRDRDFEKARLLTLPENHEHFQSLMRFTSTPNGSDWYIQEFEIVREKISDNGLTAAVYFIQLEDYEKKLRLRKVADEWKVDFRKLDLSIDMEEYRRTNPIKKSPSSPYLYHDRDNKEQREGKTALEIAKNFLDAMANGEWETARKYSSRYVNEDFIDKLPVDRKVKLGKYRIYQVKEEPSTTEVFYVIEKISGEKRLDVSKDGYDNFVVVSTGLFERGRESEQHYTNRIEQDKAHAAQFRKFRDGKSAMEIAKAFFNAMDNNDGQTGKRYASRASGEAVEYFQMRRQSSFHSTTVLRVEEHGAFAVAYYTEKKDPGEKELTLGKDPYGNWQVIMTKDPQ